MNKEQQDQLWNELSEESRKAVLEEYNDGSFDDWNGIQALEVTFGTHNLNPKPQIKTWEDFVKEFHKETDWNPKNEFADLILYGMDDKIKSKIIATAKIAKLIELGYGGMVSEEEWKDEKLSKYYIEFVEEPSINCSRNDYRQFISFHSRELAEEFMSHESNRKLVEQYYMM